MVVIEMEPARFTVVIGVLIWSVEAGREDLGKKCQCPDATRMSEDAHPCANYCSGEKDCEVFVIYCDFFGVFIFYYLLLLFVVILLYISIFYSVVLIQFYSVVIQGGPCPQGGGLR